MIGQLTIFDISTSINFPKIIAKHIKKMCAYWNYDWAYEIQKEKTCKKFMQTCCQFTKTMFFNTSDELYNKDFDLYGVEFDKEYNGRVYKCGAEKDKTIETVSVEEVLKWL